MAYRGGHLHRREYIKIRQKDLSFHPSARIVSAGRKGQETYHCKSVELHAPGDRSDKTCAQPQRRSPCIGCTLRGRTSGGVVRGDGVECVSGGKGTGIEEAPGKDFQGKLALWQVMARVIDQGSRLSAVRLAQVHAAGDVLDMKWGFDENDLYDTLSWLSENQAKVKRKLLG